MGCGCDGGGGDLLWQLVVSAACRQRPAHTCALTRAPASCRCPPPLLLLHRALSSAQHMMVIRFNSVIDAFGNFTRAEDWSKFARRMAQYGSVWCCVDAHPGHIHYDMLWDVPGHEDRHGRIWSKWEPKTGP